MHAPHDGLVCPYSPHVLVLNRHGSTWRGWRLRGMHMHGDGRCFRGWGEIRPTSDDVDRCGRCSTRRRRRRRRISVPLPRCRCPGSRSSLTLVPSSLDSHSKRGGWGAPLSAFSFTHKNGDISNGQTFWRGGGDPTDGEDSKAVSASLFQTFNFSIHSAVSAPSLSMSVSSHRHGARMRRREGVLRWERGWHVLPVLLQSLSLSLSLSRLAHRLSRGIAMRPRRPRVSTAPNG